MPKISLRRIKAADKKYFAKWWRDKGILKLTSGDLRYLSDEKVEKYFQGMYKSKTDFHYMIDLDKKTIGNISLEKQRGKWGLTQIVIGEKDFWGKGYGTQAIRLMIKKAEHLRVTKIYLEVRPNNLRAIRAYEKCGFQKIKTIKYPKNKYLPLTLRMELK